MNPLWEGFLAILSAWHTCCDAQWAPSQLLTLWCTPGSGYTLTHSHTDRAGGGECPMASVRCQGPLEDISIVSPPSLSLRGPEAHTPCVLWRRAHISPAGAEREQSEPHSYTLQYHSMVTQRSSTIVNQSLASFTYSLGKIILHTKKLGKISVNGTLWQLPDWK